jgi:hypothetical protein
MAHGAGPPVETRIRLGERRRTLRVVAYSMVADKYLGPFASRLSGINQPIIRFEPGFQPLVEPSLLALDIPALLPSYDHRSRQPITALAAGATAAPGRARLLAATTRDR